MSAVPASSERPARAALPARPARNSRPAQGSEPAAAPRLPLPYLVIAAVLPMVLLLALGLMLWLRSAPAPAAIGTPAPDFTVSDLNGEAIQLSGLTGRPVVINFWASWCPPCVEEFPMLSSALERHAGADLTVIGIVYQDRSEAARAFMRRMGAAWSGAMDPGGRIAAQYGVYGPPATFFIDRDGTVVGRHLGPMSSADLERNLAAIIAGGE